MPLISAYFHYQLWPEGAIRKHFHTRQSPREPLRTSGKEQLENKPMRQHRLSFKYHFKLWWGVRLALLPFKSLMLNIKVWNKTNRMCWILIEQIKWLRCTALQPFCLIVACVPSLEWFLSARELETRSLFARRSAASGFSWILSSKLSLQTVEGQFFPPGFSRDGKGCPLSSSLIRWPVSRWMDGWTNV